ncbi:MAG: AI-2E family transporter [Anaerolineales bacterium]|nr:AI-2E family transporter [Anaerolineales bacterium]
MPELNTNWSSTTKYIVAISFVLVFGIILYISRPVLGMIAASFILTFLTYPIARFLKKRWRFPRGLAVIASYLFLALILALIPLIVTPIAIDAFRAINFDAFVWWFQRQIDGLEYTLFSIRYVQVFNFQISLAAVVDPILETLAGTTPQEFASLERLLELIPTAFNSVTSIASFLAATISSVALSLFLTIVMAIYLSLDINRFYKGFLSMFPDHYRKEYRTLIQKIANVWSAFFRGQITVSLILALITWIGALIVGLPGAFILALTAGVFALIPSLGPVLALIPAVIVALVQGSTYLPVSNLTFALIVLGMYLLIQQLEGNIITPRIVGQAIDLPPVVVLMGVIIGTTAAGLLGTVLAAPIIATGRVMATYAWNKMFDQDPFYNLEHKRLEPVELPQLAETVRATQQQLQEKVQQFTLMLQSSTDEEE